LLRGDDLLWIRRLTFVVSAVEFIFSMFLLRAVPINAHGYSLVDLAIGSPRRPSIITSA